MLFPILVVLVGLIWLLKNLGLLSVDLWQIILPVAVILAGLSMMNKKHFSWSGSKEHKNREENPNQPQ